MPNTILENTIDIIDCLKPFYRFDDSLTGMDEEKNIKKFDKLITILNIKVNVDIMDAINQIQDKLLDEIYLSEKPLIVINKRLNRSSRYYNDTITIYDILQLIRNTSDGNSDKINSISLTNFNTIIFR